VKAKQNKYSFKDAPRNYKTTQLFPPLRVLLFFSSSFILLHEVFVHFFVSQMQKQRKEEEAGDETYELKLGQFGRQAEG
jgi:hypothetical protein